MEISFRCAVPGSHHCEHRDCHQKLARRSIAAHGLASRHVVRTRARGGNVVPRNAMEAAAAGIGGLEVLDRGWATSSDLLPRRSCSAWPRRVTLPDNVRLPEDARKDPVVKDLAKYGCLTRMFVRLLAPRLDNENHTKDIDFSPTGHNRLPSARPGTMHATRSKASFCTS